MSCAVITVNRSLIALAAIWVLVPVAALHMGPGDEQQGGTSSLPRQDTAKGKCSTGGPRQDSPEAPCSTCSSSAPCSSPRPPPT